MADSIAVQAADDQEDKGKGETFLSIFDVPIKKNTSSTQVPVNEDLKNFDPSNLFDEFSNLAEQERIEHEKNEAEIAEKLSSYSSFSDEIEEQRQNLIDINLSEKDARALPDLIQNLYQTRDDLTEQLTSLENQGRQLEEKNSTLGAKITDLKKFLEGFRRQKEENIKKFGGQEKGEKRFLELESKTEQAVRQNQRQAADNLTEYQAWKIEATEALAPILKNLKIAREGDKLTADEVLELKNDFEVFLKNKEELNNRTAPIIEKINEKQALIEDLMKDERIPARISKFEKLIVKRQQEFVNSVLEIVKAKTKPEETLLEQTIQAFYKIELAKLNQINSPEKKADSAATLAQSLIKTLGKIANQSNINLDELYSHLKNLNQNGTLPPSSKGYNDVLFLAYCLGITGHPERASQPFATEAKALLDNPKEAELYTDKRLKAFKPVLATLKAGFDLNNSQPTDQPRIFGIWLGKLEPLLAPIPDLENDPAYSQNHKQLSAAIREFVTSHRQIAHDQARQIELKLKGLLKRLEQTLSSQTGSGAKLIKLDSYALTVEQAQEFSTEVTKLSQEYSSLGPIKLGNNAKKLQDEVDRFSKLLLLKVPELRKAAEIVNFDLGRIDVGAPDTINPKLEQLATTLKEKRIEAKEKQASLTQNITDLKAQVKEEILNNQEIETVINSTWLDKSYTSDLISLYAQVEEEFLGLE
ncbi:hypothetical protein KC644_02110 [Candidatus Berkelbacteria bacterium]|nr:hypothetical protein [Candidatus Berkelbacteria bacterium]